MSSIKEDWRHSTSKYTMNICNIRKAFELKKERGWDRIYFCIDLHGTIIPSGKTVDDIQEDLTFYPYAEEVLTNLTNNKGIVLILWSSIPSGRVFNVNGWLNRHEIYFDYFNSNPEVTNTIRSEFDQKFYFNVCIDDRAGFEPETDWKAIKDELIAIGEWK